MQHLAFLSSGVADGISGEQTREAQVVQIMPQLSGKLVFLEQVCGSNARLSRHHVCELHLRLIAACYAE